MMPRLTWTKSGCDWIGIYGKFRAKVNGPKPPLGFCHWSVYAGDRAGGSGGTNSVQQSKRAAEREVERFAAFLTKQAETAT